VSIRAVPFVVVVSGATGAAETKEDTMSIATAPTTAAPTVSRPARSLRRTTVVSVLAAAAATAVVAAAAHGAGIPLEIDGETIPPLGFAQMTLIGALVGGVLLAVLNRRSQAAGRRFVQAAVALTALSCVPSIVMPEDAATKVALVLTHLVAAAIIIPALARHARS
jgi:peptidoglycan/LPS O-acetylase OafA/YrhL